IVGDGAIYYYIQDIVVAPAYQKRGVGTAILTQLCDYIRREAPPQSFIGLFSVPDAINFYRKFTFEQRDLVGLFTVREIMVPAG
ncbi:MAG: GNAT family N-acetyltransferase, partial [Anaerolineales bacterium]|nr:GNAT family N-acetyltransferase [Anaerolineales bacterium]